MNGSCMYNGFGLGNQEPLYIIYLSGPTLSFISNNQIDLCMYNIIYIYMLSMCNLRLTSLQTHSE